MRLLKRKANVTGRREEVQLPPVWTGHADYVNPFEFITFMRLAGGLSFDIMLEAKVKDLALLRLRRDLQRYAPDIASRFGLAGRLEQETGDETIANDEEMVVEQAEV
jgi:UV DNA damage endonuclease